MKYTAVACLVLIAMCYRSARAQERFELVAPDLGVRSEAVLTARGLDVISASGAVSNYERDTRFDSPDGAWLGYYDRAADRILRWPLTDAGPMQIGTWQGNTASYRTSRMTVQPLDDPADRRSQRATWPDEAEESKGVGPLPQRLRGWQQSGELFEAIENTDRLEHPPELMRLAAFDRTQTPWLLARGEDAQLRAVTPADSDLAVEWWVAPAGAGCFRLETHWRGSVMAVSTTDDRFLAMRPLAQDPRQLWRVRSGGRRAPQFVLESVFHPGRCLAHAGDGQLILQAIAFAPRQLWVPLVATEPLPDFAPFSRSINRDLRPNPPLSPARVELTNSHRNALIVLLGDVRSGDRVETFRIEPQAAVALTLDRDAGATIVETIETRSPAGHWERQEFITPLPARALYDVSVYEEHLQSIAIDRTGKSPNPIEDINVVPKSIGWFMLPAGTDLPSQGQIDTYRRARESNNPGAVRRVPLELLEEPNRPDPLEAILDELQPPARRSF